MRRCFVPVLLMAIAGCTAGSTDARSTAQSEPSTSTTVALDRDDPRPLLTMGSRIYGPTDYWQPQDLADVYVYPDGTVIRVTLAGSDTDETRALQLRGVSVDDRQVRSLIALADAAGLTGSGLQPLLPLPDGEQVQDGGARVFTARHGDDQTSRAVDQLSEDGAF